MVNTRARCYDKVVVDESVVVVVTTTPTTASATKKSTKKKKEKVNGSSSSSVPKTTTRGKRCVVAATAGDFATATPSPRPRRVSSSSRATKKSTTKKVEEEVTAQVPVVVPPASSSSSSSQSAVQCGSSHNEDNITTSTHTTDVVVVVQPPQPASVVAVDVVAPVQSTTSRWRWAPRWLTQPLCRGLQWVKWHVQMVTLVELVVLVGATVMALKNYHNQQPRTESSIGQEIANTMKVANAIMVCGACVGWWLLLAFRMVVSYVRAWLLWLRTCVMMFLLLVLGAFVFVFAVSKSDDEAVMTNNDNQEQQPPLMESSSIGVQEESANTITVAHTMTMAPTNMALLCGCACVGGWLLLLAFRRCRRVFAYVRTLFRWLRKFVMMLLLLVFVLVLAVWKLECVRSVLWGVLRTYCPGLVKFLWKFLWKLFCDYAMPNGGKFGWAAFSYVRGFFV